MDVKLRTLFIFCMVIVPVFFVWGMMSTVIDTVWKLESMKTMEDYCYTDRQFPSWSFVIGGDFPIKFHGYVEGTSCFVFDIQKDTGWIEKQVDDSIGYIQATLLFASVISVLVILFIGYQVKEARKENRMMRVSD